MRNLFPCGLTSRRELIWEMGGGFASLALVDLLSRDGFFTASGLAAESMRSSSAKATHFQCKLNRKGLPTPGRTRPTLESAFRLPGSAIEKTLTEIWADVLGLDQVGVLTIVNA